MKFIWYRLKTPLFSILALLLIILAVLGHQSILVIATTVGTSSGAWPAHWQHRR